MGIIDGTNPCPPKFHLDDKGKEIITINLDFVIWQKKDQYLLCWLNAKPWFDQLAVVSKSIDDDDLISYINSGLNPIFHPSVASYSFAIRDKPLIIDEF